MAYNLGTAFMDFTSGVLEADKKNTKENLLIRGKELDAKRDAIIEMKKSKYKDEMDIYKSDKVKIDNLNAVKANLDKGVYNYKDIDGATKVDSAKIGYDFLVAKHGIEWVTKQKANKLGVEGDPTAWNSYLISQGKNNLITDDVTFKNFKTQNVIESNYLEAIEGINNKYSAALKAAKNDSSLIKAILGKKNDEIANLSITEETSKDNITTIDSVNETKDGAQTVVKTEKVEEVPVETEIVTEETDTTKTDTGAMVFGEVKQPTFVLPSWKEKAITDLDDTKKFNYVSKEASGNFASIVLTTIPDGKQKDFFSENKDGSLQAKESVVHADATIKSIIQNSTEDLTVPILHSLVGNDKSKITDYTNLNKRYALAKKHVNEYGNWVVNGKVFGTSGSVANLLTKSSNALTLPSQSVIDMNTNQLQGFGNIIPNDVQSIPATLLNKYTRFTNNKEPKDMNVRTYVGEVYTKFLLDTAKQMPGNLEDNINKLQIKLQSPNAADDAFTQNVRSHIAEALGIGETITGEKTMTETAAYSGVGPAPENMLMTKDGTRIPKTEKNLAELISQAEQGNETVKELLTAHNIPFEDTSLMAPNIGAIPEYIWVIRKGKRVKVPNPAYPKVKKKVTKVEKQKIR